MNTCTKLILPALLALGLSAPAFAASDYTMTMKGGAFDPPSLEVPAHEKIHLTVKNAESVQTEFESYELNQEQKIESGDSIDMYIGPLEPGEYPIFDDNNPDAKGSILAK